MHDLYCYLMAPASPPTRDGRAIHSSIDSPVIWHSICSCYNSSLINTPEDSSVFRGGRVFYYCSGLTCRYTCDISKVDVRLFDEKYSTKFGTFHLSPPWNRAKRPFMTESKAMEAAGHMHSCYYRSGFDISAPLYPKAAYPHLAGIPPGDREFFLTVKVG